MSQNYYGEKKERVNMTLTRTAINWLTLKMIELQATSRSDVIEKLARQDTVIDESNQSH